MDEVISTDFTPETLAHKLRLMAAVMPPDAILEICLTPQSARTVARHLDRPCPVLVVRDTTEPPLGRWALVWVVFMTGSAGYAALKPSAGIVGAFLRGLLQ